MFTFGKPSEGLGASCGPLRGGMHRSKATFNYHYQGVQSPTRCKILKKRLQPQYLLVLNPLCFLWTLHTLQLLTYTKGKDVTEVKDCISNCNHLLKVVIQNVRFLSFTECIPSVKHVMEPFSYHLMYNRVQNLSVFSFLRRCAKLNAKLKRLT